MLSSYDLLVQAKTPGEPFAREPARAALQSAGATIDEQLRGSWKLPGGEVELQPILEGGACVGVEVRVPLSDRTELLEAVVRALGEIAERVPVRLLDPQRSELVSVTTLSSLTSEFFRLARHAGEYGGVGEALGLTSYVRQPEQFSAASRVLGALLVFAVALYATWRIVTSFLDGETEAAVNPPAEVLRK